MKVLLSDTGFWVGFGAAVVVVVLLVLGRAVSGRWWGGAGLAASFGALVGLGAVGLLPGALVAGAVLLGAAALLTVRRSTAVRVAVAVPGAALVALGVGTVPPTWVRVAVGVGALASAVLVQDIDHDRPRLVGVCVAVAALGVYVAVPDTEQARALVGAAVASSALGLAPDARPDPAGSAAAVGLIAWAAGIGGWTRPGAVVGGIACVGLLVLGPVLRRAGASSAMALLVHVGLVAVVARIAGLRERAATAGLIAAAAYALGVVVLVAAGRVERARRPAEP